MSKLAMLSSLDACDPMLLEFDMDGGSVAGIPDSGFARSTTR